ncbi:alpha/beta hydrolase [uncultured Cocleimonas sp.]|uniref:RBBP9/YdeN family alpha/beta hydrolase n=1 Tax=uncultured Cocleimonas sp. TaxID=1051587 RepID=UPI0026160E2E|nr:alpha/beta hydrolase [uncultured Cocleimonas sp.]
MKTQTKILTLPGYLGSDEGHWQTIWEQQLDNIERVQQNDWEFPQLSEWLKTLNSQIQNSDNNIVLVSHSLGCSLINHWAANYQSEKVIGALMVAPADIESDQHTPEVLRNFAPMPIQNLPFPSIVVTSDNDPYVSLSRAQYFADCWGSRFINYGPYGHLNAESGLGNWEYGKELIEQLINTQN